MDATTQSKTAEAIENGAERAKTTVREGYESAKEHIKEGYDKVSEKAHDAWDKAADTSLHDIQKSVHMYVRRNPGKSLAVALGIGLVSGLLLRGHR